MADRDDEKRTNEPEIIIQDTDPGDGGAMLPALRQSGGLIHVDTDEMPATIVAAGQAAQFAYEEFFYGEIANEHTRRAYHRAVKQFLAWIDEREFGLQEISPKMVREYLMGYSGAVASRKLQLSALRHFFDVCVTRHAMILNPALSVRGERLNITEGKTPEISIKECRKLLGAIDSSTLIGKRDRAIIYTLIYTAARVGAIAKLQVKNLYSAGSQWMLHFDEKGGKSREIPVRHDLQEVIFDYFEAAGIEYGKEEKPHPLFRSLLRKEKRFSGNGVTANDVSRMLKRRFAEAGLSERYSAHSFRVTTITDLLEQDIPLEDVQRLAGHADPRTTRLYDRRQRKITRNIVERISV